MANIVNMGYILYGAKDSNISLSSPFNSIYADLLLSYYFQNRAKSQNGSGARELESLMFL